MRLTRTIASCACAGSIGGAVAGCVDFAASRPHDSLRLLLLLIFKCGAVCGIASAALGTFFIAVARLTDLHAFWVDTFSNTSASSPPSLGAPWLAYTISIGIAILGYGLAMWALYEKITTLVSPPLVPLATSMVSMSLVVASALAIAILAKTFSIVTPFGERIRLRLTLSPEAGVLSWTLGFLFSGAAVRIATLLLSQHHIRPLPFRRLIAFGAPAVSAWSLVAFHFAAQAWSNRTVAREVRRVNPAIRYLLLVFALPPTLMFAGFYSLTTHGGYWSVIAVIAAIITTITVWIAIHSRIERARSVVVLRLASLPLLLVGAATLITLTGHTRRSIELPLRSDENKIPVKDSALCEAAASCVGDRVGSGTSLH